MSQATQPTISSLMLVPHWDPIATLSIDLKPDGHFTCSGVKNGTTDSCGYHLRGEKASKVNHLIDDISISSPQSATQSLRALADLTLCPNHGIQARGKVTEWSATINRLSPPTQSGSNISSAHTPSPSPSLQTEVTPQSTPGSNSSLTRPQQSENRSPNPHTSDATMVEEVSLLRKEIELLTARIASLEAGHEETAKDTSQRKVSNRSLVRSGLRSAFLGRN
ncbi:uncharacterized protein BDZ99DRAFT_161587 [Mytilinidion resinicola]|uniref:Uncharacterized protein n=1 Tax=Mytilinidion resinicola TaxID=574789 RepID=A0A6A6Y6U8_9PEZI|nr:uncharacterized protein BDZ99DRAFT_161587 [Mytilinidion resinicola]KAF2803744.1 hypothetical protein BDZ99DRAFT_161587 [Mytilinidion resinicola]